MKPTTAQRERRGAKTASRGLAWGVVLGVLLWCSAGWSQEGVWPEGRLQLPSANGARVEEGPLPPASFYDVLGEVGTRSRVSVQRRGEEVVVSNANPFAVQVYDITLLRYEGGVYRELRGVRPVRVEAGEQAVVGLRELARSAEEHPRQRAEAAAQGQPSPQPLALLLGASEARGRRLSHSPRLLSLRAHPLRFGLALPLDALEGARRASQGEVPGAAEALLLAGAMEEFLRVELASAASPGYPTQELEVAQQELDGIAARLEDSACEVEERLAGEALGAGAAPSYRALEVRRLDSMRELGERAEVLTSCFGEATWAEVLRSAEAADKPLLAEWAAARYRRGAATPEPFRTYLIGLTKARLREATAAASSETGGRAWRLIHGYKAQVEQLEALQALSPGDPLLGEVEVALGEQVEAEIGEALDRRDFERSGMLLALLSREAARGGAGARERFERAHAMASYREGKFIYSYRRGEAWDRARGMALLRQGAAWAPVRARLYMAGLVFVEHQFTGIFGLMGLAGLVFLGLRSRGLARLRQRGALARARWRGRRGAHREALDRYWGVLSWSIGEESPGEAEQRLQAAAAAGVLEEAERLGDSHEAHEAQALLARVPAALRPAGWQGPEAALARLEAAAARGACAEAAQVAAQLGALFPGSLAARRGAALAAEAGAVVLGGAARYEAALASWGEVGGEEGAARLGQLAAQVGPGVEATPEAAWSRAWSHLAGLGDVQDAATQRARAMSAAVSAPLGEALEALEVASAALPAEESALSAALYEAARRAPMPLSAAEQGALARLDDLLEARGGGGVLALEARLRVAVLRRLGLQAEGAAQDVAYQRDLEELMAQARHAAAEAPGVRLLAAALDLLTPGDLGFDGWASGAEGDAGVGFALLEALDAFSAGRGLEAAARLASLEEAGLTAGQAARLDAARATIAEAIGQRRAAREALGRASGRLVAGELDASGALAVRRCAARLAEVAAEEASGAALRAAAEGLLLEPGLSSRPVRWCALGAALARRGWGEVAEAALARSAAEEGDAASEVARRSVWGYLAAQASAAHDYARAQRCAIVIAGEA